MLDDHFLLSETRNHLADALKALLKAEMMGPPDFKIAMDHATAALSKLQILTLQHFAADGE